jgi:heme/copper-type cytochrome/quinol oxidase subunit 1
MLRVLGGYIVASVASDGGWFGYAPLSRATYPSTPLWPYALSLALIAVWAAVSVWLLGLPYESRDGRSP